MGKRLLTTYTSSIPKQTNGKCPVSIQTPKCLKCATTTRQQQWATSYSCMEATMEPGGWQISIFWTLQTEVDQFQHSLEKSPRLEHVTL